MKRIVLISCVSMKLDHKAKAEALYISPLFAGNLRYAKQLNADEIFILSAKHGLLKLEDEIEPYNMTLNEMSSVQAKAWAASVLEQLKEHANLNGDHFIFLAGDKYRKHLVPHLASYEIPLEGMPIGKMLQFHAQARLVENGICHKLHHLFVDIPKLL